MQEFEAIERLKQGDMSGQEYLVKAYQLYALRAAYLIVRDYDSAEDVVQDAFLRAYERIDQFDASRPFKPWFFRIVINLAKRAATKRERHVHFSKMSTDEEVAFDEIIADLKSDPDLLAEQHDLREMVWLGLGRLPPPQRAAMIQRYYLDMTEEQIANYFGVALGTIKWRLHAAHKQLRVWLRQIWPIRAHHQQPRKEIES